MRRVSSLVGCAALVLGCRTGNLEKIIDSLKFSSPDQPAAVTQPDATDVAVDFGTVGVGATKTLILQFVSATDPILLGAVTAVQPDDEFDLPFVPGTLVQLQPQQITVSFAPSSLGAKTGIYALATNAGGGSSVRLMLTGTGVPQALMVSPDPIAFGNVELNQTATLTVTITNNGATSAILARSALPGAGSSPFAVDPLSADVLAPGDAATFEVHFSPLAASAASSSFTLSGCAGCGELTVQISGAGVVSLLQVTPDPLHFGFIQPGDGAIDSVTLANVGSQVVHLLAPGPALAPSASPAGISFGPPLATTPGSYPFALAPGQRAMLPISFVPPRLGFFSSSLSLASDDPGATSVVVPIDGYGGGARIACLPSPLAFGPVAAGQQLNESVLCTNVGTDVPAHPEAALAIASDGVATEDSFFTAKLGQIVSGAPFDGGVTLNSGQTVKVEVTYAPLAEQSDKGLLIVTSNDSAAPSLGVPLSGQGVTPGACSTLVTPPALSFGEVPKGASSVQQLGISNTSQSYCVLSDIAIDPASDPAFVLPGGPVPYALLGFPGNPGGAPTTVRLPVKFAPLVSEAQATGMLTFLAAGTPAAPVPLSGTSAPACLVISPSSFDFGRVGFSASTGKSCFEPTTSFTAQNICGAPVTVDAIAIDSGLDATPQFGLVQSPSFPLTIVPAGELTFAARFSPTSIGPKAGAVTLTSSEFPTSPYRVSLLGDAELSGQRVETFTAQQNKVDLVFVLDNDDDLTEIQIVAQELPEFIQAANNAQLDYRIAVTSTDICGAGSSDRGSFEPCAHCTSSTSPDPLYLMPETPNAAQLLSDLFVIHNGSTCGSQNSVGDEQFFGAIEAIFQPALLAGHNAGFLRDDAYLALVVVNGDGEDDRSSIPPQEVVGLVQGLKPNPAMVSISYIDTGLSALSMAPLMTTVIQATGGVVLDTATQWVPSFFDLFWATERLGGFVLTTSPDPTTLRVDENGVPFPAESNGVQIWSYNPTTNAVVFTPQNVPVPGTVVTISYMIGCD